MSAEDPPHAGKNGEVLATADVRALDRHAAELSVSVFVRKHIPFFDP